MDVVSIEALAVGLVLDTLAAELQFASF